MPYSSRIKMHMIGVAFGLLIALLCIRALSIHAYELGKLEARFDLWRGNLIVRHYGLAFADGRTIILKRYGIRIESAGGCVVSRDLAARTYGYNEVMQAAIDRRYGVGAVERELNAAFNESGAGD